MVLGQLLGYTACETTDMGVTFFPTYGSEQRGGTANCYVVISDRFIGTPVLEQLDDVIVLNEPSMVKFESRVKPGGTLFVNDTIISTEASRDDIRVIKVPASRIADEVGTPKVLNIVMLGAYIGFTRLLPEDKVLATILKKLGAKRPHLNPMNEDAFTQGLNLGRAARANAPAQTTAPTSFQHR